MFLCDVDLFNKIIREIKELFKIQLQNAEEVNYEGSFLMFE